MCPWLKIGDLLHIRYNIIDPYKKNPKRSWVIGLVTETFVAYGNRYVKVNLWGCETEDAIDINLDSPHYDGDAIRILARGVSTYKSLSLIHI